MFPKAFVGDGSYGRFGNSEFLGYGYRCSLVRDIGGADLFNNSFAIFSVWMRFASWLSPLGATIKDILSLRSKPKMLWVRANRVIARVANIFSSRNISVVVNPRKPRCSHVGGFRFYRSVSVCEEEPIPSPASFFFYDISFISCGWGSLRPDMALPTPGRSFRMREFPLAINAQSHMSRHYTTGGFQEQ